MAAGDREREAPAGEPAIGPLHGIRVIDCTHVLAGSYCTALLADMGADVVKVERPGGDPGRGPDATGDGFGPVNRNKRSLTIDLRAAEGPDVIRDLARHADVFVENYRPGSLARMGLGPDDLECSDLRPVRSCDLRLRADRAVRGPGWVRPGGAGHERSDERDGRARTSAREGRRADR